MRVSTAVLKSTLDQQACLDTYAWLRDNVQWVDGIRSRSGPTRKAHSVDWESDVFEVISPLVVSAMFDCGLTNVTISDIYINYYRDGDDWTPTHSHKGTTQVIISLGADRVLNIGSKSYILSNGDVAMFGASVHGVPKDLSVVDGRISIAIFIPH